MQMLHGEVQPADSCDHKSSEIAELKEALGIPFLDTDRDPLAGPQEEDGSELTALDEVSLGFLFIFLIQISLVSSCTGTLL